MRRIECHFLAYFSIIITKIHRLEQLELVHTHLNTINATQNFIKQIICRNKEKDRDEITIFESVKMIRVLSVET